MFFKKIFIGITTQVRSIFLIILNLFAKSETKMYPEEPVLLPPRYKGRIILTLDSTGNERCVACGLCSAVCPASCISLEKTELNGRWYAKFFRINFSRCIFCGLCEEACPTTAIQLVPDFELSEYKRKDLVYEKSDLLISGPGKYPDYNFYERSGINIESSSKGKLYKKFKKVDVKTILP
ncbi:NADH dehydrogenase I subunit I [Buchnera aphidicola (Nipponaphis monzeni)]|uniref:NADH-quinone oxidoreductase subunit I n=1 Tax=Buchnera aphidicola (Nipponaphis monzeni) TaxID=2495405 RepID=A0A455T9Y8_9GAMM|nr:NADH-quinone oxidoreductase subunit NuoI [Buchnera aphidicola]BBI01144.1 NADH dehydrogenase I subunit I [Buchnera aphidicola (Nipponaphis monzeni)]